MLNITEQLRVMQQGEILLRSPFLPFGREACSSPLAFLLPHHTDDYSFPNQMKDQEVRGRSTRWSTKEDHRQLGFRVAVVLWGIPWDLYPFWSARPQVWKNANHKHKVWWMLGITAFWVWDTAHEESDIEPHTLSPSKSSTSCIYFHQPFYVLQFTRSIHNFECSATPLLLLTSQFSELRIFLLAHL